MAPNLTIKHNIFGLLALALVAGVAGSGYVGNKQLADSQAEIVINFSALKNHLHADMMHDAIHADVMSALYASKIGNTKQHQNAAAELEGHVEELRKTLQMNAELPLNDDIKKALEQVKPALESYITRADAIVSAANKDHAAAAAQLPAFVQSVEAVEKEMATLSGLIAENTQRSKKQGEIAANHSIRILTATAMVSFVVLFLIYYFLSKGDEVRLLNARLEERVLQRTEELHSQQAELLQRNNEILFLNADLEERVQQRTDLLTKEIAERKHGVELLRDSEAILSATINSALDAVVQMDAAGIITRWNTQAEEIFGWKRGEAIGRMLHETIIPPQYREAHIRGMKHFLVSGEGPVLNKRIEISALHRDGHEFPIELSITPLKIAGRYEFTAFIRDITERKRAQDEILSLNAGLEERVQQRTEEMQSQQEELRQSNEELVEKNKLLADQNVEIEASKRMLEEKAEQLALTSKYKSEFLSSMSHELRTPLNSMLILAQLLAENAEHNLREEQIEYAKTISGAGNDLLELINDILDLSKIESGTVTLELQDISLASIGEQIGGAFRHMAQSRGLGFGVELAPGLPLSLYTDSSRLQQVLKNLLSNAFKFTKTGQVSLRIAPVESGWSVGHDGLNRAQTVIGFFVTDTGIGVPASKQKIIFEAFQQADTGTARKYGGTGLGLSISREIARLLGGEMRLVESSPGKGSTFVLYHPLRAPESGQGGRGTPGAAPGSGQMLEKLTPSADILAGKKVLVVDDDMRNIFALTAALERRKMAVLSAENGRAALKELAQNPDVDIVLMDIMMPEMDGYETMRQIRQMKQFESLPMIALTAKAMKGDRETCIEAGASDYISKPVDTDQLLSLLRVWLYRQR